MVVTVRTLRRKSRHFYINLVCLDVKSNLFKLQQIFIMFCTCNLLMESGILMYECLFEIIKSAFDLEKIEKISEFY